MSGACPDTSHAQQCIGARFRKRWSESKGSSLRNGARGRKAAERGVKASQKVGVLAQEVGLRKLVTLDAARGSRRPHRRPVEGPVEGQGGQNHVKGRQIQVGFQRDDPGVGY